MNTLKWLTHYPVLKLYNDTAVDCRNRLKQRIQQSHAVVTAVISTLAAVLGSVYTACLQKYTNEVVKHLPDLHYEFPCSSDRQCNIMWTSC